MKQPENKHTPLAAHGELQLEAAVVQALRATPKVDIPGGFAARVAAEAYQDVLPARALQAAWGPRVALFSVPLLAVLLFWLAPYAHALSSTAFEAELLLVCELGGLAVWLPRLLFPAER